jgi:hypothetical protein
VKLEEDALGATPAIGRNEGTAAAVTQPHRAEPPTQASGFDAVVSTVASRSLPARRTTLRSSSALLVTAARRLSTIITGSQTSR